MFRNDASLPFRFSLIPAIIALNVIVFAFWRLFVQADDGFMARNFLVSWTALLEGRVWTLLTSVFSHYSFLHLLLNMFVLRSFGSIMEQVLGRGRFLSFYLVAGIVSSLCHSLVSAFFIGEPSISALGASGAISGLVLVFSLMFPKERILIFGIIPVPALFGALAFVGLDLWGLFEQRLGGGLPIGHGAHLGGALTGLIYYFAYVRRHFRRMEA
jgi:rhomboid-like protein